MSRSRRGRRAAHPRRRNTGKRRRNSSYSWTEPAKAKLVSSYVKHAQQLEHEIEQELTTMVEEMENLRHLYLDSEDEDYVRSGFANLEALTIPSGAIAFLGLGVSPDSGWASLTISPYLKLLVPNLKDEDFLRLLQEITQEAGDYCDANQIDSLLKGELGGVDAANCYVGAFYQAGLFPSIVMAAYENIRASTLSEKELRKLAALSLASMPLKKGHYLAIHYGKDKADPARCKGGNEERCVTELNFGIDVCMFDCTQALWAWVVLVAQGKSSKTKLNPSRRRNSSKKDDWTECAKLNPFPAESDAQLAGATRPVVQVSWLETISWLNCLSMIQGLKPCYEVYEDKIVFDTDKNGYRLPSEMEWEVFACANQCYVYAGSNDPNAVAWYADNSGDQLHAVGQKQPNGFGLYDCSGNVYEMTFTPYDSKGESCGDTSWFNGKSGVNGFKKEQ